MFRAHRSNDRLTALLSAALVALGALVLLGWTFDVAVLKGVGGAITMKANAALALISISLALGLRPSVRPSVRNLGRACVVLAGLIGMLTLSEHVLGWNAGIDELLFREAPGAPATTSPGRMGPNASVSLTLAAIAVWWLYDGRPRRIARAQILGACIGTMALVPTVGYLYGATQLYAIARLTGIALHTGLALLALSVAILAARADSGPVAALMSGSAHAVAARRWLVLGVVVPLVTGCVRLMGERRGWYDGGFGTSMFVVVMIVLFAVSAWRTSVALGHSEDSRLQAQRERDEVLVRERHRAERSDRAKDEFIAALSHELRTPINAIAGWTQILRKDGAGESARLKALEAVSRNTVVLTRLIDDLLDTSRITTGHLALATAPVDVNAVVHAAVESVMPVAESRRVRIAVLPESTTPVVRGDAHRLQQVLWNLLSNAVKFSPPGATVRILVETDGGDVVVQVHDEGDGIEPEFLPRVFDQFQQGPTAARGNGSLGLGLHIAKHLVERHGGSIRAHSDGIGRGAVFTIRLPCPERQV